MIQANKKDDELMEKIRKGLDLTFQKLIQQKSLTDGELIISKDDKIVKIKARDLLNKYK